MTSGLVSRAAAWFDEHRGLLDAASAAIAGRSYWSAYPQVPSGKIDRKSAKAEGEAAVRALLVNQSSALSDFLVSGGNPAGNASLTDAAFVANRFRVLEMRRPVR